MVNLFLSNRNSIQFNWNTIWISNEMKCQPVRLPRRHTNSPNSLNCKLNGASIFQSFKHLVFEIAQMLMANFSNAAFWRLCVISIVITLPYGHRCTTCLTPPFFSLIDFSLIYFSIPLKFERVLFNAANRIMRTGIWEKYTLLRTSQFSCNIFSLFLFQHRFCSHLPKLRSGWWTIFAHWN